MLLQADWLVLLLSTLVPWFVVGLYCQRARLAVVAHLLPHRASIAWRPLSDDPVDDDSGEAAAQAYDAHHVPQQPEHDLFDKQLVLEAAPLAGLILIGLLLAMSTHMTEFVPELMQAFLLIAVIGFLALQRLRKDTRAALEMAPLLVVAATSLTAALISIKHLPAVMQWRRVWPAVVWAAHAYGHYAIVAHSAAFQSVKITCSGDRTTPPKRSIPQVAFYTLTITLGGVLVLGIFPTGNVPVPWSTMVPALPPLAGYATQGITNDGFQRLLDTAWNVARVGLSIYLLGIMRDQGTSYTIFLASFIALSLRLANQIPDLICNFTKAPKTELALGFVTVLSLALWLRRQHRVAPGSDYAARVGVYSNGNGKTPTPTSTYMSDDALPDSDSNEGSGNISLNSTLNGSPSSPKRSRSAGGSRTSFEIETEELQKELDADPYGSLYGSLSNAQKWPKHLKWFALMLIGPLVQLVILGPSSWKVNTRGNTHWMVVTTVNLPTSTMEALCALDNWEVAVVADLKTPRSWSSGPACHFLSTNYQSRLPFRVVSRIPYKAYTRKSIGYLFAIANGAELIQDTDDDNLPNEEIVLQDPDSPEFMTALPSGNLETSRVINPYAHFARGDIWPRGFPLEEYDRNATMRYLKASEASENVQGRALIQQGLADLDPDVDAIFRLLNREDIAKVRFCKAVPSLKMARGALAPFNSQNTLFHHDAFWGLLLPITVTFRATDIIRGYWAQRLLWDVGGTLAFREPSVDQIRNAHDYIQDMTSEEKLYTQSGDLTTFLQDWSDSSLDLPTRLLHLLRAMQSEKFIRGPDVELAKAWVADLRSIGYEFPEIKPWSKRSMLTEATAIEPAVLKDNAHHMRWRRFKCDPRRPPVRKALLVVVYNSPWYQHMDDFLDMYGDFYEKVVFYGQNKPGAANPRVIPANIEAGEFGHVAFLDALNANPGYDYYHWTNDDVAFSPFLMSTYDPNWLIMSHDMNWAQGQVYDGNKADHSPLEIYHGWWALDRPDLIENWMHAFNASSEQHKTNLIDSSAERRITIYGGQNDFFWLPGRLRQEWIDILTPFANPERRVWHEMVHASAIHMLDGREHRKQVADGLSPWMWGGERQELDRFVTPDRLVIHPLKLSMAGMQQRWQSYIMDSADHVFGPLTY
ncbi:uncharacterized protein L969DRAFT_87927 [Mixia osmundae IAM 14324]|uniref:Uncharacterized protein n=1 Tax=Mixia osmundae (strain CBS 9802 / IAM 14324 / JCM 22182 / KY 12970) TaxID=764103 RepID=G7E210_MIXOS|nr:uncharacterized protein L969DRAFT_87927 [Mixia osmundae IAM 14324]KEI38694.1 hypothetical protein L969DRAFT_87927 [Mixia osmundae IAM 14324]GAA96847.1 hypothetical protein E5Q_03520 [Mixia osmundae IAM 14324]